MPYQTKATRSHRFILSASGIAIITLILMLMSPWASANIAGANHRQTTAAKQISPSNKHSLFATGDVDFDYAVNLRMHHQLAVELSQEQIRNGKNPRLRGIAIQLIAAHKKEIDVLDRWMASQTKVKTRALLSSR